MLAVNYTTLRDNMKGYFDRVSEDCETLIVTRKDENMVIMSQSSYDSLMETMYLMSSRANYEHLMEAKRQFEAGKGEVHELIEVDEDDE